MAQRCPPELVAALDIGGTKIEAGVVDAHGTVLARRRVPTPRQPGDGTGGRAAEELFDLAAGAVSSAMADAGPGRGVVALGVGCGGPMSAPDPASPRAGARTVSPLNIPQWRGFPLGGRLAETFGIPVRVDNDAKALALAEGAHGAARGVSDYMAMVVSTGVGGGIVLDGRLLEGEAGNAGHVGHVVVDPLGRRCACGARGCLEAQVSGRAIEEVTGRPAADAPPALRRRCGILVGRAVASVCNLLDLRLTLLAGSVALGFGEQFIAAAQGELDRLASLGHSSGARIGLCALGADGPLVGAARVGWMALGGEGV